MERNLTWPQTLVRNLSVWMRWQILFLIGLFNSHSPVSARSLTPVAYSKPLVVLIPGFFNSLAIGAVEPTQQDQVRVEPYFSDAILKTFERTGYDTAVVDNLEPVGTIEANGDHLLDFLHDLISKTPSLENRSMILIGHSAGGLYAMHALTREPSLPVQTLATIATPYKGVGFLEKLTDGKPLVAEFLRLIDLASLFELMKPSVQDFLTHVNLPNHVRLVITGGSQEPCFLWTCAEAENLSWLLTISHLLTGEASDGIVAYSSAVAQDVPELPQWTERPASLVIHLEHWEQVLDYRVFSLLGVVDTPVVEKEQQRFYAKLLNYLATPPSPP